MTYYEILGITQSATQDEIKRAYRNQLKQWHPDVNKSPDALEKTQKIIEAWEVLQDKQKKEEYDNLLVLDEILINPPEWLDEVKEKAEGKSKQSMWVLLKEQIWPCLFAYTFILCIAGALGYISAVVVLQFIEKSKYANVQYNIWDYLELAIELVIPVAIVVSVISYFIKAIKNKKLFRKI